VLISADLPKKNQKQNALYHKQAESFVSQLICDKTLKQLARSGNQEEISTCPQ
jgi:hypothetical protein